MGKLDNQATTTLIVNGEQAKTSLKEVTSAVRGLTAEINNMHKADDPALYAQKIEQLQLLKTAQAEMRTEIMATQAAAAPLAGSIKDLNLQLSALRDMAASTADPQLLASLNAQIQDMETSITRLSNAGRDGFDTFGNAIQEIAVPVTGSIKDLNLQLTQLRATASNTADPILLASLNNQIQDTELQIKRLGNIGKDGFDEFGNVVLQTTEVAAGSVKALNLRLGELREMAVNTSDPKLLATLNAEIQETEIQVSRMSNAGREGFDQFGNAIAKSTNSVGVAWGWLRKLAQILPGIGIAGIIAFATEPIINWVTALIKGNDALNQTKQNMQAIQSIMADAGKDAGQKLGELQTYFKAATDVNNSMQDRIAAAEQLKKEFPDELASTSALAIANGDLKDSYDQLAQSIIATARAHAAQKKIDDLEGQSVEAQLQIDQNNAEKASKTLAAIHKYRADLKKALDTSQDMYDPNEAAAIKAGKSTYVGQEGGFYHTPFGDLQESLRQIKEETDSKNVPYEQTMALVKGQVDALTTYAGGAKKLAETLSGVDKLIKDPLKNFDAIIKASGDKDDLERLKTALQAKLDALAPNDKQIAVLQARIRQVEELEKRYNPKPDDGKREADARARANQDALNKQQDLTNLLARLNQQELTSTKSKNQQEIDNVKAKYDAFIQAEQNYQREISQNKNLTGKEKQGYIGESNATIDQAKADQQKAVNDVMAKQARELSEEIKRYQDDAANNFSNNLDKELNKNNEFYDKLKQQLAPGDINGQLAIESGRMKSNSDATVKANLSQDQKYLEDKKKLEDEYDGITDQKDKSELAKLQSKYDAELAMFKDQLKQKQITQAQYDKLASQSNKNFEAGKLKLQNEQLKNWEVAAIDMAQQVANTGFDIQKQNIQSQENSQVSALEKQRNNELSNRNLTQTQIAAINDKYNAKEAAIKLKAWQAQQKANEEQVLVNGALAVAKLYAEHPTGPFDAMFDISLAAILVNTATQEALIASQQAPQFGKGGLIKGKSHAQGGVPLIDGNTGMPVAEVEGDEVVAVFSRETVANNGMLINELLYNGQHRNGAPVSVNTTQATTALRQYATGGIITATAGASQYHGTHAPMPHFSNADVVQAINALGDKINNKKVILNRTAFDEEDARYTEIVRRARLGG